MGHGLYVAALARLNRTQTPSLTTSDLKYDNCNVPAGWADEYNFCVPDQDNETNPNGTCPGLENPAPEGYDWSTSKTAERYRRMRAALGAQDRPILLSLCNWGHADVISWARGVGISWRMSGDIFREYHRKRVEQDLTCPSLASQLATHRTDPQPELLLAPRRRLLRPQRPRHARSRQRRAHDPRAEIPLCPLGSHEVAPPNRDCRK